MGKQEFLAQLRKALSGLPQSDIEERLNFYSEMIDDRMDEGLSEEEAVSAVGTVNEIVAQSLADSPRVKEKSKTKRRLKPWEVLLLVLGSPIWLSLLIAAFAVILSAYISLWSVIISLWTVFISVAGCAFGGIMAGVVFACVGNGLAGIAMIGAGFVCTGLAIFLFFGCKAATKGTLLLTKKIVLGSKNCFLKKEDAK